MFYQFFQPMLQGQFKGFGTPKNISGLTLSRAGLLGCYHNGVDSIGESITDQTGNGNDISVFGFTANWTGAEYLTAAHITGSETVVDKIESETSEVTISAGRIDFTAGTCSYLELSNGDKIVIESSPTSEQINVWDVKNHNTYKVVGASTPFFTIEKNGSYLLAKGFSETVPSGDELFPDLSVFSTTTGVTIENGVMVVDAASYGSNVSKSGVLGTNQRYKITVKISGYKYGAVRFLIGDTTTSGYTVDGVYSFFAETGDTSGMYAQFIGPSGTKLNIEYIKAIAYPVGLIPASVATPTEDIFGNSLNRLPGRLIGSHCLLYAPETTDFYDLATSAGIVDDLYSAKIVSIGLSPDDWLALCTDRSISDYLFLGNFVWVAYSTALTGADITRALRYVKAAGPYSLTVAAGNIADTSYVTDNGSYLHSDPLSRVLITTESEEIVVNYYNYGMAGAHLLYADIGVIVDGNYTKSISPSATGAGSETISLRPGMKTVEFVNSAQASTSESGVFVTSIDGDQKITPAYAISSGGMVLYGDSITVGFTAGEPPKDAWSMRIRYAADYPVSVNAYSGRGLYHDANTTALLDALIAYFVAMQPAKIWLAIGTNDYLQNLWSASDFGDAYADLLDAIHEALPTTEVYCQSQIVSSDETANGSGDTLGDYRSEIETQAGLRSGYCTFVDGSEYLTTDDLSDGIHPTTAGHLLYANAVKAELGISD